MHLTIELKPRDPRGLAAFAQAVSTPGSAEYRDVLTVTAFARRFGAGPDALRITAAAFRRAGLRVGAPTANGLALPATGSAAEIDQALHTQLDVVRLMGGATGFANRVAPEVPAAAIPYVEGVSGLDELDAAATGDPPPVSRATGHARRGRQVSLAPQIVTGGPQPCSAAATTAADIYAGSTGSLAYRSGYTADELAAFYGFSSLYGAADRGAGQTVAIDEEEPYQSSDVQTFQQCYGTAASVTNIVVGGGVGTTVNDDDGALGIEAVTALAPDAKVLVYEGSDQIANFTQMVSDDKAQVISSAWPRCEAVGAGFAATYETLLAEAAAQGQSVFASSGDAGSTCGSALATQLPASSPYVTAVGGTTLYAVGAGAMPEPWSVGRTPAEAVWNNGIVAATPTGTGGGLSSLFGMPAYQSGAAPGLGVLGPQSGGTCGAADCREVPDVSADGDAGSGYVIFSRGVWKVLGGTGFATPLWAAFAALTNSSSACRGASIGLANPSLYLLAGSSSAQSMFNDITSASPRTAKANNDAAGTQAGRYPVNAGYDMATGLGSMQAAPLAAALCHLRAPVYTIAIANPGTQMTTVGTPASLQLQGVDAGSLPLTYTAAGLPPGLSISNAGTVTGTPTTAGTYTVTAHAADAATNQTTIQFAWTIVSKGASSPPPPPVNHAGSPTIQTPTWAGAPPAVRSSASPSRQEATRRRSAPSPCQSPLN